MVVFVYLGLCLIWSTTWLAIKYAIHDVSPVTAAAARFWVAAILFMLLHAVRPIRFPKAWSTRLTVIAWGIPQIGIGYALVYWSERHITSGMAAVLFATFPFFVAATSARLSPAERWTRWKLFGLLSGLAGVVVVFADELRVGSTLGAVAVAAVVGAACSCGVSIVFIKRAFGQVDTVALTALQMMGGALALSVAAVTLESPGLSDWTLPSVAATLYLAVFGSAVAFFGYYWLLKRVDSTAVATITFVTPVLALVWGWLIADEPFTVSLAVGSALVLVGVWSVARSQRPSPSVTSMRPSQGGAWTPAGE